MKAKDIAIPTITLVIITFVITALLVLTNGMTADRIAQLQAEADAAAKQEVLAEADSFTTKTIDVNGITYTYDEADNGTGYVFSTQSKGYGGAVVVMTGITSDGAISGTKVTEQNETPGLGQKALNTDFTDQYKMPIPQEELTVVKTGKTKDNEIDSIAGATITSRAVTIAVNEAVTVYEAITGGAQ